MKKLKIVIVSVVAFATTLCVSAQNDWNLRANAGIAIGIKFVDGYYFSFDFGIPLSKSLQIAPTFTSVSALPNTLIYNDWNSTTGTSSGVIPGGPRQAHEYGQNISSISLLLLFSPFELSQNEKLAKHELLIGAGISYNSYTTVSSDYEIVGNDHEVTGFSVESNRIFQPYYCKISYNYLFRDNLFMGAVTGINGVDGEAQLLIGVQFGIKFK